MIKKIQVDMLGCFNVKVDNTPIMQEAGKLTKPWQLFCYLVLHRGEIVTSNTLLQVLWSDEDLADPANVLKNTVYALRKELCGSKVSPADSPVVFRSEGYCLNNHFRYLVDTEDFMDACARAEKTDGTGDKYVEQLNVALAAYKGEFLPMLDSEPWAVQAGRVFRNRFMEVSCMQAEALEKRQRWNEALSVSTRANLVDPYCTDSVLHLFRSLQGMQMYRSIVAMHSKQERFFADEMNVELGEEIEQIYNSAQERVNRIEQDMMLIRQDLYELSQSESPSKGAFYCNYETFRRMYLLLARTAQRSGEAVVLLLVNVQDRKNRIPMQPQLNPAMETLHEVISLCLRRSDVFCRYAKNQYVVLLPTNTMDNAQAVVDRMKEGFVAREPRLQLVCRLAPLTAEKEPE